MRLQKIIDVIITLIVWFIVTAPIHEFWHYQVGEWLGGSGFKVTYPNFLTGRCSWTESPDPLWMVYMAGGALTGCLMLLLAWRAWKSPTKWDEDDLFVLTFLGGGQIGYGLAEVSLLYAPDLFIVSATIGTILGVVPALAFRLKPLWIWIDKEPPPTH